MSCSHNFRSNTTVTTPSSNGRTLSSRLEDGSSLATFSRSSHSASFSADPDHWTSTSTVIPRRRSNVRFASSFSGTITGSFPTTISGAEKSSRKLGMKSEGCRHLPVRLEP